MLILCDGGDGGWGGVGGCWFNAIDTLVYSNQTTHAQSHLAASCHCRHTSLTLVTRRTRAYYAATNMIWMGMMTVIHKSPNYFSKLRVSDNDTY